MTSTPRNGSRSSDTRRWAGYLGSRADSLHGALSAIRHHHERWDGTGYPDRLSGTDIPLSGRIVAVADVWDALTSDRAYRPAWDLERAVSHLAAASGTLFDPACVEAFLDVVAANGLVPEHTRADLDALVAAAIDCHPTERRPGSVPPTASTVREDCPPARLEPITHYPVADTFPKRPCASSSGPAVK